MHKFASFICNMFNGQNAYEKSHSEILAEGNVSV